ncbi:hypothetical protein LXA43DRAFT_350194 [Ganoderma leucocontextum]|nr:hypothetical protein LXA43DRAFT_350194 [Ganoderma leucocontextum]
MPSSGTSDQSKAKNATPQAALVIVKDDMEDHFSNLHYHAWGNRSSESSLYPLYSLILTLTCFNLRHPNEPRVSLMSCPQPFFGKVPQPGEKGNDPSDPSARKMTKEQKKKQRLLPSYQFPDFARLLIFTGGGDDDGKSPSDFGLETDHDISEFFELKRLNCRGRWWSTEAKATAKAGVPAFLPQVHDAAMAGFAYNPEWKTVYAILIVGVYFTQIRWDSRPSDQALKPIIQTKIPTTVKAGVPYRELIGKLLGEIDQYLTRPIPEISFYNEPVFTYDPPQPGPEESRPGVSLSPKFLYALSKPTTTRFPQLSPRSTLFESRVRKPSMAKGSKSEAEQMVKTVLRLQPIQSLKGHARSLGHRFPGDTAPTPTPPNSIAEERYKATVKNIKELPTRHIKTRMQMQEVLFDPEHENENGDGDDAEVEP